MPWQPELWCYTDEFSYRAGDEVGIKVHSTAATFDIEIIRDGHSPTTVYDRQDIPNRPTGPRPIPMRWGAAGPTPLTVTIDPALVAGVLSDDRAHPHRRPTPLVEREGFFLVRNPTPAEADFVLIHATSTVLAYNDWGGANHRGLPDSNGASTPDPISSARRPIATECSASPSEFPKPITMSRRRTGRPAIRTMSGHGWQRLLTASRRRRLGHLRTAPSRCGPSIRATRSPISQTDLHPRS